VKIPPTVAALVSLTSRSTAIGVWFHLDENKIQNSGGGGQDYGHGAPAY
jgi:hypothetical protein